jgi:riboflavin biosynthesis pyrimidine reductase
MRALLPEPASGVDLHEYYGTQWLTNGGIRANMIASADGAASASGLSRGLQTPGDNAVFAALRDLADVVVAGVGTVRAEQYRVVRLRAERRARRTGLGLAPELPTAVISRSLRLDVHPALFEDGGPIVVTTAAADPAARAALADRATVLVCGDDDIDFHEMRRQLAGRGLVRVLCEGGPTVLSAMLAVGAVDELCLSISPLVTGPGAGRIVAGAAWAGAPLAMRLIGLLEEDGALFARYALPGER